ncbi:divergent polysaccharide deacetylase family protein [Bosea vestrisii]|uniref:divergent polysaccharide deacetylase family protein n=1 Tax=Bosea vestrisii TaxID=151416 RepID=UPI0024DFB353|nr:divergent polysaccharide deacetylase family protein [Bosea vestrisii]WID99150.1 divergent polysaccharide deacetylase family protein [Bosea vestrisii]
MAGLPLSELDQPLGQAKRAHAPWPYGRWLWRGLTSALAIVFTGLALYAALKRDPVGGEPIATAMIRERPSAPDIANVPPQPATAEERRGPASANQLETDSGVTVVRPGADAPGAIIITVPDDGAIKLAPSPDKRLVERTRHGLLPKIGPDGATPLQVYARPLGPAPAGKPAGRIAILVGGLGISQSSTSEAIARLPGPVSLAFAPYGADLEKTVQRARSEGHEVFLQVPMEPFDYPDNDPGPHTLLTGPKGSDNLDRLQWALGRVTGYVGIVNFLGGRLTADDTALTPLLREIAGRGLMVVDDGSSPRSLLASAATKAQIPALKADLALDAVPRAETIDRELQRLETLARDQGAVIATASALPVTIERITRWARTLEGKNLVIIPVSAARGFRNPSTTGSLR